MSLVSEAFLDLLEQDTVWWTGDGRVMPIEAMDFRHRAKVLRFLERTASELYSSWVEEFLAEGLAYDDLAVIGVHEPDDATLDHDPDEVEAWFSRQPLVRRLRQLAVARPVPAPGASCS
jgi:hypothetical protein